MAQTIQSNQASSGSAYETTSTRNNLRKPPDHWYITRGLDKKESWLSCAKSVDRAMPLDAMVILAVSLENMIPVRLPKSRQQEAKKLVRSLWDIIRAKAETIPTQP